MNKPRVTIVEDDESVRHIMVEILRRRGFEARGYGEAERALSEEFDLPIAPSEPPDLVIVDLLLEGSQMQGMDLIGQLVARDVPSVILAVSGHASSADLLQAMRSGASDCVTKPFDFTTFVPKLMALAETGRKIRQRRNGHRELDITRLHRPVFLSYPGEDRDSALVLKRYLEARDVATWYAPSTIRVGDDWQGSINKGVNEAKFFIALITDNYFSKPNCIDELLEFDLRVRADSDRNLVLLPVLLGISGKTKLNPTFQSVQDRYQCLDISGYHFLDGLTALLLRIQDGLAHEPRASNAQGPSPTREASPASTSLTDPTSLPPHSAKGFRRFE
jgi:FixJ family two-component response regulator